MTEQTQQPEQTAQPEPVVQDAPPDAPQDVLASPLQDSTQPPAPAKKRRPLLRAALRWTAAVVVFAAVGAGTAYGITGMDRTDVPGLATHSDGRWDYPTLVKPPLPSGSPAPFDERNTAGAHYADLRKLVLPEPKGAVENKKLRGTDGWLETKDFLAEYADKDARNELGRTLVDDGLRHVAARGWTTPDGTHTRVYLLQFNTAAVTDELFQDLAPASAPHQQLRGAGTSVFDVDHPIRAHDPDMLCTVYVESKPYGAEQVRQGYLSAGDVLAVIVQSRKGGARAVPFRQTVALQSELLG
ncbi:hypothetical protein LXH13_22170 [Streptomyces spinosirectus]|uniref:hypothetical protein n=1 Tax=Streptomyces TaxID=1883 RepID=UPI001C9DF540|nr:MULTISPECIES: hypothetical protein [Streptomyces]MBY8340044.1 hypothetical protein [Streptomyces plumbidurans]UIR19574.1 hypothetical protein LXH13_22170 [Streptomyces spinosirectus]